MNTTIGSHIIYLYPFHLVQIVYPKNIGQVKQVKIDISNISSLDSLATVHVLRWISVAMIKREVSTTPINQNPIIYSIHNSSES